MKKMKKWPFVLAIALVAFLGVRAALTRVGEQAAQAIQAMNVVSEVAELGDIARTVTGTGSLAKVNSEEVVTRVGLVTEEVFVREGDVVEKGTPIASYTKLSVQTELLAVRKNIAAKKKEIDDLDKEADEYELEKSVAEGELNALRKSQAELEKLLEDPVLKSDVAGVVETVNLKAGEKIVKNSYSGAAGQTSPDVDISSAFSSAFANMSAEGSAGTGPVVSADGYHVSAGSVRTLSSEKAQNAGGFRLLSAEEPFDPALDPLEAVGIDIGDGSSLSALCALTVPVTGNAPQTTITLAEGQTLIAEPVEVVWEPAVSGSFDGGVIYGATVTLRAAGDGYFYSTEEPENIEVSLPGAVLTQWSVGDTIEPGKYGSVTVTAVYPMTAAEPTPTEEPGEPTPTEEPGEPTPTEEPGEPTPTEGPSEPTPTEEPGEPTPTEEPGEPTPTEGPEVPTPTGQVTPTPADPGTVTPTPTGTVPFPPGEGGLTPEQMQVLIEYLRTLTPEQLEELLRRAGAGNIDLDGLDLTDSVLKDLIEALSSDSLITLLQTLTDSLSTSIPDLIKALSGLTGGGSGLDLSSLLGGGSGAGLSGLGGGLDLSALTGGGMDLSALTGAGSSVDLMGSGSYDPDYTAAVTVLPGSLAVLSINVDELDINSLTLGQDAVITLDALEGQEFEGVITDIADVATPSAGSARFPVELVLVKTDDMKYGMSASAVITVSESKGTVLISMDALQSENGQTCVYTELDENGEPSGLTAVETGLSSGTKVEIVSGLSSGTTVYYKSNANNGFPFAMGRGESEDEE